MPFANDSVVIWRFGALAWIKERAVRRILCVLLISSITAAVLPSPVGAETVRTSPKPVLHRHVAVPVPHVSALAAPAAAMHVTIAQLRAEWQRVAICEVGGNWSMTGGKYSGIGFLNATWYQYGGLRYAPFAGEASEDQQILIGMKVTNGWVPDQYGCSRTGW